MRGGKVGYAHRRISNLRLVLFAIINWRFEAARLG